MKRVDIRSILSNPETRGRLIADAARSVKRVPMDNTSPGMGRPWGESRVSARIRREADRAVFITSCVILAAALSGMLAGVALALLGSVSCL